MAAEVDDLMIAFNRGIISPLAAARFDVARVALSAEKQTNWMPRVLGPMMLRVGTGFIGRTLNDQVVKSIPFVFSASDTAWIELERRHAGVG